MSTDSPTTPTTDFDHFVEHQREIFNQWMENLTGYYQDIRIQWKNYWDKTNQRDVFLTFVFTFVLLTILTLLFLEYRRVLKTIRQCFQGMRNLLIRLRNLLLRKTTPSILSILLNSNSSLRQKFTKEFLRALNHELSHRKVKADRLFR